MGVDDDVDLIGCNACPLETLHQLHLVLVDALLLFTELRTNTCLNQHGLLAVTNQQRVGSDFQHVARVRLDALLPEHLGHHPKKRSSVQLIGSVSQNQYFKIPNRRSNHASLPSSTSLSSRGRPLRRTTENVLDWQPTLWLPHPLHRPWRKKKGGNQIESFTSVFCNLACPVSSVAFGSRQLP